MLRLAENDGWWLITHPDHARLAGTFAAAWGNAVFLRPEPRSHVLHGIAAHDDGWADRDATTPITRDGKPAAFSVELVGLYSAFEEIDLEHYLNVRRNAVELVAARDAYAAILISMHTHNLLSAHVDRSTLRREQLSLLDAFLAEQRLLQARQRQRLLAEGDIDLLYLTHEALEENFRLLQACDNLSLLSCVDFGGPATLLHPLRTAAGHATIEVERTAKRTFRLTPWPFAQAELSFELPARFVAGNTFASAEALRALYDAAPVETLRVTIAGG